MKKITYLLTLFLVSVVAQSQTTISQSTDPATIDTGGVACWNSTSGVYRDNAFARTYNLASFGITNNWNVTAVEFGQGAAADGKIVHINIYTSDSEDLTTATLSLVSTTDVTLQAANDMTLITVPITGTTIPANSNVVVEVFAPDEGTVPNLTFFPGFNLSGENSTPWIKSAGCSITWSDANTVGGGPQPYVINLTGQDATASVSDNLEQIIEIYPSPVSDKLHIKLASNIQIKKATLYNLIGKNTGITLNNDYMNTTNLTAGIYFLKIDTNKGSITKKIIKK